MEIKYLSMMKFFFLILFMGFMLKVNKMLMYYYNLCYFMGFLMLFTYLNINTWNNISLYFGISYYSLMLIILSVWILGLMIMCLSKIEVKKMMVFFILLIMLIIFFSSLDLLLFYLSFEISLIPTFFLILYWGTNPERVSASYYLMMYMLLFSFPLLIYIVDMYMYGMSLKFSVMCLIMGGYVFSIWKFFMIYMSFFIKMPVYLFHVWLPKAHVEAPVYGSMILAGILLKMGSYGLIRFFETFLFESINFSYIIFSVGIIGALLISMVCLVQIDMKSLVAYSSVVHMNMMMCSMLTFYKMGFISSYIMMIGHGLCSSGMFYMVNLYYSRSNSRLLYMNKGMLSILPSLSIWWFLLCVSNFSFPFSINFISEIFMLSSIINWDKMMMIYMIMICFFSSAYSLYLYSYIQYGSSYMENKFIMSMVKEKVVMILHIYPLCLLLLNMIIFV